MCFWWEWVDSNHLSRKTTDLQSAPALQLRRTPNPLVRAEGIRTYKNTMSCVISNELMFASQGYPIHTPPATSLVRAEGIEPSFQAWKACILAFELCSQRFRKPPNYILFFYKRKHLFKDFNAVDIFARNLFQFYWFEFFVLDSFCFVTCVDLHWDLRYYGFVI